MGAAVTEAGALQGGNGAPARAPLNPYLVLLIAILLPGFGHVVSGQARRGLTMQLFGIALAIVTWNVAPSAASLIGKLAGGLFIYALSLPEAYRIARIRWEAFYASATHSGGRNLETEQGTRIE